MRVFVASLLVMILIIIGWFYIYDYIKTLTSEFIHSLNVLDRIIDTEDWNNAYTHFNKIDNNWNEAKMIWKLIIDHEEIHDINFAMAKVNKYVELKDKSLSLGEIEYLKRLFESIVEAKTLNIQNIL